MSASRPLVFRLPPTWWIGVWRIIGSHRMPVKKIPNKTAADNTMGFHCSAMMLQLSDWTRWSESNNATGHGSNAATGDVTEW